MQQAATPKREKLLSTYDVCELSEVDIKEAIEFQEERINALEGKRIIDVEAQ